MTPLVKNILLIGVGTAVFSSIVGFQKFNKVKAIFDEMDIEPDWVSNLNVSLDRVKLRLNVKLTNNSLDDLFVTGSAVAQLKKIIIYYKNNYLATANVNINEISLPAKNSLVIKDIPVEVNTGTALSNLSSFLSPKLSDFTIIGIVEALGVEYEIGG